MKMKMRYLWLLAPIGALSMITTGYRPAPGNLTGNSTTHFTISLPSDSGRDVEDGRLILLIAKNDDREPRFQYRLYETGTQLGFGIDVDGWVPGTEVLIDSDAFGFPIRSLDQVPAGRYYVQAVLNRYETFHRADGQTVKLPPDRGEGQQWNLKPGNLYSAPQWIDFDPASGQVITLTLDQEIPEIDDPVETEYVKFVRLESELLSEFWGRPMHLGAIVLLPHGFHDDPGARYPIAIHHGHFPTGFSEFSEAPPSADLEGYARTRAEYAYDLYQRWTSSDFPRMIVVKIQHPTPYYDDSYAVNSENNGPYGDAITDELIPFIEAEFQGLGEPWARTLFGGSTGGWEALAAQVFYPDSYNGAWAFCPDAVDFHQHQAVNVYEWENAYYMDSDWKSTPIPSGRNNLGHIFVTMEEDNHWELVVGTRGRSGGQWDIWQAVYSPVGGDGYPKPIWDKLTGEIDGEVAEYWRENYDLKHILERDWATLGPKVTGNIHIYTGDMDTWYLNNSVYLLEDFLQSATNPAFEGTIEYGDRYEHCWTGDHENPLEIQRLTVYQRFIPIMAEHIRRTAPAGADLGSWPR